MLQGGRGRPGGGRLGEAEEPSSPVAKGEALAPGLTPTERPYQGGGDEPVDTDGGGDEDRPPEDDEE
jgi:hypothetical protein